MEENYFFKTVNEALKLLDSYGFSPMKTWSESFTLRHYGGKIVIEVDPDRSILKLSMPLDIQTFDELYGLSLQINCSDSISISNRIFISFSDDRDIKLGRVVHVDKPVPHSVRDCILDFIESFERDRKIISGLLINPDVETEENEKKTDDYTGMLMGNFLDV